MRNVFKYLLITALVLLIGCSRDKRDESVNEEASPEVTEEPVTGTGPVRKRKLRRAETPYLTSPRSLISGP